jgi:hypothetical protein
MNQLFEFLFHFYNHTFFSSLGKDKNNYQKMVIFE